MTTAPCKDCADRCIGCHSKCEKYKAYKDLREKELERIKNERMVIDGLMYGISIKNKNWGYSTK